jgi:hypothetical protein
MREDMRKRGMPSPDRADTLPKRLSPWFCSAHQRGESRRRRHHRGLDDQGPVIAEAARLNTARAWAFSVSSRTRRSRRSGRTSGPRLRTQRTTSLWTPPTISLTTERDYSRRLGSGERPGERPMPIFERSLIPQMQRRWRTLLRCWPTVTIPMSFTPASSLKRLLSHLHPSYTRHSTSHGRAYNRADEAEVDLASITTRDLIRKAS